MELYQHQVDFLAQNPDKTSLVWSCGTGKTRAACEWSKPGVALIICPKSLAANWQREVDKWGARAWIVTKEYFRKTWEGIGFYDCVIVDEVHNGFLTPNFKSQMSRSLKKYLKKWSTPRVLLLSATVYTSSPWNIYNLAYYTGHIWDYMKFKYKFFREQRMGMRSIWVPKENVTEELAKITKSIASVVDIHDCMDVPEQLHMDPEYFALTKEQQKAIKEAYDPVPIVRYTYQHEIENGVLLANEFRKEQFYETDKEERIKELCAENKKVAIVCRYNAQLKKLAEDLKEFNPKIINGETSDRDTVTLEVEKAEKAIVLIQADCAEGFQLPSFELCIFASMSYAYTKFEQICGRFLRMDKPSRTTFMYLLTEGDSIDQAVYDAIKRKTDFQIQLYQQNEK